MATQDVIPNNVVKNSNGVPTNLFTGVFCFVGLIIGKDYYYLCKNPYYDEKKKNLYQSNKSKPNSSYFALIEQETQSNELYPIYKLYNREENKFFDFNGCCNSFRLYSRGFIPNTYNLFATSKRKFISYKQNESNFSLEENPPEVFFYFEIEYKIDALIHDFLYINFQKKLSDISEKNKSEYALRYLNEEESTKHITLPIKIDNNSISWIYQKSNITEFLKNSEIKIQTNFFDFKFEKKEVLFKSFDLIADSPFNYYEKDDKNQIPTKFAVLPNNSLIFNVSWSFLDNYFPFIAFAKIEIKGGRLNKSTNKQIDAELDNNLVISIIEKEGLSYFINEKNEITVEIKGDIHMKGNFNCNIKETRTESTKI